MRLPKRNKITKEKNLKLDVDVKYKQAASLKPNGFWYSCYNSWYSWVRDELMDEQFLHKYIQKINIKRNVLTDIRNRDATKLLVISNEDDFDLFNSRYGYEKKNPKQDIKKFGKTYFVIRWEDVAKDYGGIEICPYLKSRARVFWYGTFDVASGCIWNLKSIISSTELIYEHRKDKYVKVASA